MHGFAQVALPGILIASALGALIMCALVFRYGFPGGDGAGAAARDPAAALLATRLGHAAAGVCFALAGILALVVLGQQVRAAARPTPAPEVVRLREDLDALARGLEQAQALADRLHKVEGRLGTTEARGASLEARVQTAGPQLTALAARIGAVETSLRQLRADVERAQAGLRQLERAGSLAAGRPPAGGEPRRETQDVLRPSLPSGRTGPLERDAPAPGAADRSGPGQLDRRGPGPADGPPRSRPDRPPQDRPPGGSPASGGASLEPTAAATRNSRLDPPGPAPRPVSARSPGTASTAVAGPPSRSGAPVPGARASAAPPDGNGAAAQPSPPAGAGRTAATSRPAALEPAAPTPGRSTPVARATPGRAHPGREPEPAAGGEVGLRAKLRDDWRTMKRDFAAAGEDIKRLVRRLRDLVTPD